MSHACAATRRRCSIGTANAWATKRYVLYAYVVGRVGRRLHFVNGTVIFPAIYAYALYAHLPGSPAVRGTIWGVVLWLTAQTMVMPMMGAGLFSSAMGGAMAAMGSLIGHVLYGSLLGIIANSPELRVAHA